MYRCFVRTLALFTLAFIALSPVSAQEAVSPNEGLETMKQRREYFFNQRAYPQGFIPSGLRVRAVEELNRQLSEQAAQRAWTKASGAAAIQTETAGQWTLIGPNPTHNQPFGGMVTSAWTDALAVDPRNANVAYLGAPGGGVWKTTDGGAHWTALTDTQPSVAIGSIAIDPLHPDTVLAGTGDSYVYGDGLLRSTNAGSTWTFIAGPFDGPPGDQTSYYGGGAHINQISFHPTNDQIVLAAVWKFPFTGAGIYRSADNGVTWTQVSSLGPATSIVFDPTNGNVAYAVISDYFGTANEGVYKSIDAGLTWNPVNGSGATQLPLASAGAMMLAMAPSSTSTLYVTVQRINSFGPQTPNSIYKTADGGATWNAVANLPFYGNKGMILTVHPTHPEIVFVGEQNPYRSMDSGAHWTSVLQGANAVNIFGDIRSFGFSAGGTTMYLGCDGGVWSTPDAANATVNWTNLNATIATTLFYPGLSFHPTDPTISFAGAQDQGVQKYSGTPIWNTVYNCDGGWTAIDQTTPSTVYATCQNGQVLKSTSSGNNGSFGSAQSGINAADRGTFIPPLVMDPAHSQTLYFGTYRLYQTTNGASSWTAISPDLTKGNNATITAMAVSPTDANRVYTGASDGKVSTTANATAGASATWSDISTGLPNRSVSQVVVDPANASTAYAIMSGFTLGNTLGHVFKTTNAGVSWTDISGNLPNVPANDLVVDPDLSNTLYLGNDIGVYSSTDSGATWNPMGIGLPHVVVNSLKLHRPSRTLRAATLGRSTWDLGVPIQGVQMSLNRSSLNFGANAAGTSVTSAQDVTITFSGGVAAWTATSNSSNIVVTPGSGSGNGIIHVSINGPGANGTVTVAAGGVLNSPKVVQVSIATVNPAAPFGSFDTPANVVTGVVGAIPVTGWALDNVEVTEVDILREPVTGEPAGNLIFIGTAVFVADARPDVQNMFPAYPFSYRAGWGYQMLTNFLPNASGAGAPGNGTYKIHAIAHDKAGNQVDLGTKTITVDNAHAAKPFGTIDTPTQGGTISGADYVNFGWALTPQPAMIPIDGSTITVVIDGVLVGHPTYNQFRSDIASLFPGYANSMGAVGFFHINTTTLANGVHTISWNAFDNQGRGEGLGSRYFNVFNSGTGPAAGPEDPLVPSTAVTLRRPEAGREPEMLTPTDNGAYAIEMEELGRIELNVGTSKGYLLVNGERRALPAGSTLKAGVFYWQAGLGFTGSYQLVFERADGSQVRTGVTIRPKTF